MRPPRPGNNSSSTDDEVVLFFVGCVAFVAVLASAGLLWAKGVGWLVQHQLLLPAAAHPLLPVPGGAGAGLDLPRIAAAAGVLLALVAWAGSAVRRAVTARGAVE